MENIPQKIKSSIQKIMVFIYGITCLTLRRQCKNLLKSAQKSGLQISSNGFLIFLQDRQSWWTVTEKLYKLLKAEAGIFACRTDSLIIPSVRVLPPSLTILLNHIMEQMKESSCSCVEKNVTGVADYPDESLNIKVNYFNLDNDEYFLFQIGIGGQPCRTQPIKAWISGINKQQDCPA